MDQDLALAYGDARLPRYTSYPTAPHFNALVTPGVYEDWLQATPRDANLSLYLHIPFCRAMCWYCGCHTVVSRGDRPVEAYLELLKQEIDLVERRLPGRRRVTNLHFGGGTPTVAGPAGLVSILERLRRVFAFAKECELAIEIDPRAFDVAMARVLGSQGFTRASLGVQSFDVVVQRAINRMQSFAQTASAAASLRDAGVRALNVDLVYGLPGQSVPSCLDTVERCLELAPDRFSVFGYAHVPSFRKNQRLIDERSLPDLPSRRDQKTAIAEALQAAGYESVGLDHYALPGDELARAKAEGRLHRNFQGYTTDASDALIGLGASAIGRLAGGYVQNAATVRAYAERIRRGELATVRGRALTPDDRVRAEIIERIMCEGRADVDALCARRRIDPAPLLEGNAAIRALEAEGMVSLANGVVTVAARAASLLRTVASAFDSYLDPSAGLHSRAV